MSTKPSLKQTIEDIDREGLIEGNNRQLSSFTKTTTLVCGLWALGDSDRSYDLFRTSARAYGLHSMETATALILTDPDMNLTNEQIRRILVYLKSYDDLHLKAATRTRDMIEVFTEELKNRIYESDESDESNESNEEN